MRKKFLRRNWDKYKRLGGKKKKQVWRRPKGRHNKMRLYRAGYPNRPEIGMKKAKKLGGKILGMKPVLVRNINDLKKAGRGEIILIARVGKKKRNQILAEAEKLNLNVFNQEKA